MLTHADVCWGRNGGLGRGVKTADELEVEAERRKLEEAGTHFTCITSTKVKILTPEEQILDTIYPLSTAGRQVFFPLSRPRSLALLSLSSLSLYVGGG